MKKTLLVTLIAHFALAIAQAQAPNKMSYQAMVRNTDGTVVSVAGVGLRLSILQNAAFGPAVYVETHFKQTNPNGLFKVNIGEGNVAQGNFSAIDWSTGVYYLKSETDPSGGTNYIYTATTQMMSVPYAMYAQTAANGDKIVNLTGIGNISVSGIYPNFSVSGPNTIKYTSGNGISISGTNQIVNVWPQVSISGFGGTTITGNYPNLLINSPVSALNYSAGTGISINGLNIINNTSPNIPVTLLGINGITVSGSNNRFSVTGSNLASQQYTSITGVGVTVLGSGTLAQTLLGQNFTAGNGISISGTKQITNTAISQWISKSANQIYTNSFVGIGFATPAVALDLVGSANLAGQSNIAARFRSSTLATADAGVIIGVSNGTMPFIADDPGTGTSNGLAFNTSSTERMRINTAGNVGIGTISPITTLQVSGSLSVGSGASGAAIGLTQILTANTSPVSSRITFGTDDTGWKLAIAKNSSASGNTTDLLTVQDNGNVGIGTTAPSSSLHIFGGTGIGTTYSGIIDAIIEDDDYAYLEFNGTAYAGITFNSGSSIYAGVFYQYSNNSLMFRTGGTDNRMSIQENGDVTMGSGSNTVQINGYTKLGSNAPAIQVGYFTGTTSASQGGSTSISIGSIPSANIISINVMVDYSTNSWLGQRYNGNPGYDFTWYQYSSNVIVLNSTSGVNGGLGSGSILSKPIRVVVTYY